MYGCLTIHYQGIFRMKKLFIVLCLASTIAFQAPAVSISAQLSGQQSKTPKSMDKAAKAIVACACNDLFPVVQEILQQSKSDIKDLVKLQLNTMALNKEQLNSAKLMIKDAQPLVLEGTRVYAALIKKHGKSVVAIYKNDAAQMLIGGEEMGDLENSADQKALEAISDLIDEDPSLNQFLGKLVAFNEKWAESFAGMMISGASGIDKEVVVSQAQESLQKVLVVALSNKRSMGIQSLIMPIMSSVKTQDDLIQIMQACLNELETKLPQVVVSTEKFAEFTVPFLATVITESVDETLQSMPA